jgi:hypothetical protein
MESKNYHGYVVFENGVIINKDGHEIKPQTKKRRYAKVTLYFNGKYRYTNLHRILAELFIPNPNNLPQVNHKDGDRSNNTISNLEWVSARRNIIHAFEIGLNRKVYGRKQRRNPVIYIDGNGSAIKEYETIVDAAKDFKMSRSTLYKLLRKENSNWKYKLL